MACGSIPGGGLVFGVAVTQPVQSWTVLRNHNDFAAVGDALSAPLGLPSCPSLKDVNGETMADIVSARNHLQEWLNTILIHPRASASPNVKDFLTQGANMIPPQYQEASWMQFNPVLPDAQTPPTTTVNHPATPNNAYQSENLDDMEMDDMFHEGDDEGGHVPHDDDDEDYINIPKASVRYKPTDEAITEDDEMDMVNASEVEMVEDIGSLAQSLGASHLGRSLQLQAQMKHNTQTPDSNTQSTPSINNKPPMQGLNVGGAAPSQQQGVPSAGGIGGAMEKAAVLEGVGDSFHQKRPQSAPRLDSFKMIKVIGKGSFGELF